MSDIKELSGRAVAAYNAHNVNALVALDAENVVNIVPSPTGGRKEQRGRHAAKQYNQAWFTAFPDCKITVTNEVISSDSIAQEGIFEGTNTGIWKSEGGEMPATGRTLKGHYVLVAKVKDGQFVSSNLYFDQVELLTQLGLMPAPAGATA